MAESTLLRVSSVHVRVNPTAIARLAAEIRARAEEALLEAAKDVYFEVDEQISPHAYGKDSKGALSGALADMQSALGVKREGAVSWIGVGDIGLLEAYTRTKPGQQVGHWAYLEFGTYAYQGEWPAGSPPRLTGSPAVDRVDPAEPDGRRGIAPNRAWRKGRYIAREKLVASLADLFSLREG